MVGTGTNPARMPLPLGQLAATHALTHGAGVHTRRLRRAAATLRRLPAPGPSEQGIRARWRYYRGRYLGQVRARSVIRWAVADLRVLGQNRADAALVGLLTEAIIVTRELTHHCDPPASSTGPGREPLGDTMSHPAGQSSPSSAR